MRLLLLFLAANVSFVSGKMGFDFYRDRKAQSESDADTLHGGRRATDRRCSEHLERVAKIENSIQILEPKMARFEEKTKNIVAQLERGDLKFDDLNRTISKLSTNTAVLTDRIEQLQKTMARNGGAAG